MDPFLNNIKDRLDNYRVNYDTEAGWQKFQKKKNTKPLLIPVYKWLAAACTLPLFIWAGIHFMSSKKQFKPADDLAQYERAPEPVIKNTMPPAASAPAIQQAAIKDKTPMAERKYKALLPEKLHSTALAVETQNIAQHNPGKITADANIMIHDEPVIAPKRINNSSPGEAVIKQAALPVISAFEADAIMQAQNDVQPPVSRKRDKLLGKILKPLDQDIATAQFNLLQIKFQSGNL